METSILVPLIFLVLLFLSAAGTTLLLAGAQVLSRGVDALLGVNPSAAERR